MLSLLALTFLFSGSVQEPVQAPVPEPPVPQRPARELKLLSFNIRYGTAQDGKNHWEMRCQQVAELIQRTDAELVAIQEALAFQVDFLLQKLPRYQALGQHREGGRRGEFCGWLVDRERFQVESHGEFWLSPKPDEIGSKGWDAALPRMAVWAVLLERRSGSRFAVMGTHFDHRGKQARKESAALIVERWQRDFAGLPFLLAGDLNATEQEAPLKILLKAGLQDGFRKLHPKEKAGGTFHGFRGGRDGRRIDFILADRSWDFLQVEVLRDHQEGRYPSDHYPVLARLSLGLGDREKREDRPAIR
ncbi:MAG: endonuclease [Planctomycetota bacterium]|nr:MAG: endonuclease [Planctomycetota bacterium]